MKGREPGPPGDRVRAAVVREFGHPPRYGEFPDPAPGANSAALTVAAAAVSPLVVSRAAGLHYSDVSALPFVPGIDGVGRTTEGERVYFLFPSPPYGSLAERVAVPKDHLVAVPEGLDDVTAAAAANPGMASWVPLTRHAPVRRGESVLVNGATGTAGRMAVQVAKYLGARRVVATGRDEGKLRALAALGADVTIPLGAAGKEFREAVRREARDSEVGVVLDYLWGPSAEAILSALGGPDAPRGPGRIRYVEVGAASGTTVALTGAWLRSSGVEIVGSGIGSTSAPDLRAGIGEFLRAYAGARFRIEVSVRPLSEVEVAWPGALGEQRLVFTVP